MRRAAYIGLFTVIQCASLLLSIIGLPVIAYLSIRRDWRYASPLWHWPPWAWIWDNKIDGIFGPGVRPGRWRGFYWSALRNPCNNLRFVPGVSAKRRPLWRREWNLFGRRYYAQAGWNRSGFPVLSAGINVNPW